MSSPAGSAPARPRVAVVGAGVSGLATAYFLQCGARARGIELDVTVLERGRRAGGCSVTVVRDGFVIDRGPAFFLTSPPNAVQLCQDLGLGDQLTRPRAAAEAAYVVRPGGPVRFAGTQEITSPLSASSLFRPAALSWPARVRLALEPLALARRAGSDESVHSFFSRRMGPAMARQLVGPALRALYGVDSTSLSLLASFPGLAELERRERSITRALRSTARRPESVSTSAHGERLPGTTCQYDAPAQGPLPAPSRGAPHEGRGEWSSALVATLTGGMARLVDALVSAIGEQQLHCGHALTAVERHRDGRFTLRISDGPAIGAHAVVFATPAPITASLLVSHAPHIARGIAAIPHTSVALVSLGYRRSDIAHPLDAGGFWPQQFRERHIAGCLWCSSAFPDRAPDGMVLIRATVGGHGAEADVALDDGDLEDLVRWDLHSALGLDAAPSMVDVARIARAIPHYAVGHVDDLATLQALAPPGLRIAGSAGRGIDLAVRIADARRAAHDVLDHMAGLGTAPDIKSA